jgi:uncharacterized membrane protein
MSLATPQHGSNDGLDRQVGRLLAIGTSTAVAVLAIGVGLMLLAGRSPLGPLPTLDPARLLPDLLAFKPEPFLWLGLLLTIATPTARVLAALLGYARRADRPMAIVAAAILGIIFLSVVLALATET